MCCAWICRSRFAGVPSRLIHANNAIISLILWQVLKRGEKDEIVTKKGAYVRDTDLAILLLELEIILFVVKLRCQHTVWLCVGEDMKQT